MSPIPKPTPKRPERTPEELEAIREKLRSIDHDSFDTCQEFAEAVSAAISGEDMAALLFSDPLLTNVACIIRRTTVHEIANDPEALVALLLHATLSDSDVTVSVMSVPEPGRRHRGKKNDPPRA